MKIVKKKFDYEVESSRQGEFYSVDLDKNTCTCVDYKIRRARLKEDCKHLVAVKEQYSGREGKDIAEYVGEGVGVLDVIKKFGQKAVEESKRKGEIIDDNGVLRVLE